MFYIVALFEEQISIISRKKNKNTKFIWVELLQNKNLDYMYKMKI